MITLVKIEDTAGISINSNTRKCGTMADTIFEIKERVYTSDEVAAVSYMYRYTDHDDPCVRF